MGQDVGRGWHEGELVSLTPGPCCKYRLGGV